MPRNTERKEMTATSFKFNDRWLRDKKDAAERMGFVSFTDFIVASMNDAVDTKLKPGEGEPQSNQPTLPYAFKFIPDWLARMKELAGKAKYPSFTAFAVRSMDAFAKSKLKSFGK